MSDTPTISIVIPVRNEAGNLASLAPLLAVPDVECILVDGGSGDGSAEIARDLGFRVIDSPAGRARQMNAGAAAVCGDILLFLHADTSLPAGFVSLISDGLAGSGLVWGRFDVRLSGSHPMFRVIERMMNWRSALTGICTGDQAIFVWRDAFPGFPEIALMEDIELSAALRRRSRPLRIRAFVGTSSRRWQKRGVMRTVLLMWSLRFAHRLGVSADTLAAWYR